MWRNAYYSWLMPIVGIIKPSSRENNNFLNLIWVKAQIAVNCVVIPSRQCWGLNGFVIFYLAGNGLLRRYLLQLLYLNEVGLRWVSGLLWQREVMAKLGDLPVVDKKVQFMEDEHDWGWKSHEFKLNRSHAIGIIIQYLQHRCIGLLGRQQCLHQLGP